MNFNRYAAIDIGTNTLLMLIAEVNESKNLVIIEDHHLIARLGEGVDKSKKISKEAISRASEILKFYKARLIDLNVNYLTIVGTSALRDAENGNEVINEFYSIINEKVKIISGEDEAKLSFLGTIDNNINSNSLLIDIGGGSTELVFGKQDKIISRKSFDIGAVRLTERFVSNNPANNTEILNIRKNIKSLIQEFNFQNDDFDIYAVAGTPTTLAQIYLGLEKFEFAKIHNFKMSKEMLEIAIKILVDNPRQVLIDKYKIHPNRADIILSGALILDEIIKLSNKSSFYVSCKGLRYGVLINSINKNLKNNVNL